MFNFYYVLGTGIFVYRICKNIYRNKQLRQYADNHYLKILRKKLNSTLQQTTGSINKAYI